MEMVKMKRNKKLEKALKELLGSGKEKEYLILSLKKKGYSHEMIDLSFKNIEKKSFIDKFTVDDMPKKPEEKPKVIIESPPKRHSERIEVVKDTKRKPLNMIKGIKNKILDRFKPSSTILVEMEHFNGTVSQFMLSAKGHKFYYNKKAYIIDEERRKYCVTSKLYKYQYHEGYALPFNHTLTAGELKKGTDDLNDKEIDAVSTSYNPYVLVDVLKFEYAKGVIQGASMSEFLKRLFIISIIIMVLTLAHLLLNAVKSGWIQ